MLKFGLIITLIVTCLVACTGPSPDPETVRPPVTAVDDSPTASAKPGPADADTDTDTVAIDSSAAIVDRTAGGELVDVGLNVNLPANPMGRFYWLDPFGNIVDKNADASHRIDVQPLDGSKAVNFGAVPWVGRAADVGGNGTYGEVAFDGESLVWQSRDETMDLRFDSYDVYAMQRGGEPVKIGESTVDDPTAPKGEQMYSAPGDGNYLTIASKRAWWVDGEPGSDINGQWSSSIYSAPLDGNSPQKETIAGGRLVKVDSCDNAPSPIVTYAVDPMSTGEPDANSELWRATLDDSGNVVESQLLLERAGIDIASYDTCGDDWALAYTVPSANDEYDGFVDVSFGGQVTTTTLGNLNSAGRVTVVPSGVFFFNWGVPDRQYYWSNRAQNLYDIGQGLSFGTESSTDGTRVVMAEVTDPLDHASSLDPRVVTFKP